MTEITERLKVAIADRYLIERELGQGGMATVYLAHDVKHDRKVALKVLRPELAAVIGAERFIQEIKTTAALQHPHILPLYDSGRAAQAAGAAGGPGEFLFYVMPYIQGETLRDKLNRETQLGIDEAVRITTEVADALQYAHEQGVVHRDIKPENILLQGGRAMVADFGIALAVSAAAGGRMTETGLSLGTPHYMSPEQATADKHVTNRSDIYSLGCMLYEMLTGEPPHTGASAQAIIMKIVTDRARPITDLRKSVPPHIAAATAQALEKLPADRFESAHAFAAALANPAFTLAGTAATAALGTRPAGPSVRQPVVLALTATTVLALAIAAWGWFRPAPPVPVVRYPTSLPFGDTRDGIGLATQVAISPDGSVMVFRHPGSGPGQLYIKRREDLTAQPLSGTEGGTGPFFSPDGAWIGFFADGQLRKIPSVGGASLKVADSVDMFVPTGTWLADGSVLFTSFPRLRRVRSEGGAPEDILPARLEDRAAWLPSALPGSRGVLFTTCETSNCEQSELRVYDARRDTTRLLFEDALGGWYAPTGQVVYLTRSGTLLAVPWDNDALAPAGPAAPVADGIQAPGLVLAADGTALYVTGPPLLGSGPDPDAEAVWVDRSGRAEPVDPSWRFNTGGSNWGLALSPDGTRLAIRLATDLGQDIWIKQLPAGPLSRLTFYEGEDRAPHWAPDGKTVTYISTRPTSGDTATGTGGYNVWARAADGTGTDTLVWNDPRFITTAFWSGDHNWLVLRTGGTAGIAGGRDILAVRPGVDSVARPLLATNYDEQGPALSPDSRWLAYLSNETGRNEVFVRPFPDVDRAKWQVSSGGGTAPLWAHNGRELFYQTGDNMMVVEIKPGPPFTVGQPRVLFTRPPGVRGGSSVAGYFDIAPDDQRFLMVRDAASDSTAQPTLVMVQNFAAELRDKARQ